MWQVSPLLGNREKRNENEEEKNKCKIISKKSGEPSFSPDGKYKKREMRRWKRGKKCEIISKIKCAKFHLSRK